MVKKIISICFIFIFFSPPGHLVYGKESSAFKVIVEETSSNSLEVSINWQRHVSQNFFPQRARIIIPPISEINKYQIQSKRLASSGKDLNLFKFNDEERELYSKGVRVLRVGRFRYITYLEVEVAPYVIDYNTRTVFPLKNVRIHIEGEILPFKYVRDFPSVTVLYRSIFSNPEDAERWSGIPLNPDEPLSIEGNAINIRTGEFKGGIKLPVQRDGVYMVEADQLSQAGLDIDRIDPYNVAFTDADGNLIATLFEGDEDHILEAGERWIFWGEKYRPPPYLSEDFQKGVYTETNYYNIIFSQTPEFISELDGTPIHGYPLLTKYKNSLHLEPQKTFFSGTPTGNDDHWYATQFLNKNTSDTLQFDLPGLVADDVLDITLGVLGITSQASKTPDHHLQVYAKNNNPETLLFDIFYDGFVRYTVTENISTNTFSETNNTLEFKIIDDLGVNDVQLIDFVKIEYPKKLQAYNNTIFITPPAGSYQYYITGFTDPEIYIFDVTDPRHPVEITGAEIICNNLECSVRFDYTSDSETRLYVFSRSSIQPVENPKPLSVDVFEIPRIPIEHLIISAPEFVNDHTLHVYRDFRTSQGHPSQIVNAETIYDSFYGGVHHPEAIRRYLKYLLDSGPYPAPVYVVIVGDESFDFLNSFQNDNYTPDDPRIVHSKYVDFPRVGESFYANDFLLGRIQSNETLPHFIIGRISVKDKTDLENVLNKIMAYEQASPGDWQKTITMVADEPRGPGEDVFEAVHNEQESLYFNDPLVDPYIVKKIYMAICCPGDPAAMRSEVIQAWNQGTAILSYAGHGAHEFWGYTPFLESTDDNLLTDFIPQAMLPFVINVSCRTGSFFKSLSGKPFWDAFMETFLRLPSRGVMGALAPGNLDDVFTVTNTLPLYYQALFDRPFRYRSLGQVAFHIWSNLLLAGALHDSQNLVLFGDPITSIRLPTIEAPLNVTATGLEGAIDLSWDAVQGANGYLVYRRVIGTNQYERVTTSLVTGTHWTDTDVEFGKSYEYRITAINSEMFESRWSDPAIATPIEPQPMPPSNLVAQDALIGNSIDLSWSPPSSGPIQGYRISFGTTSGNYDHQLDVGPTVTSWRITGLVNGQIYYFIVQTIGYTLLSAPSNEDSAIPTRDGWTDPALVYPLLLTKSGTDIILSWSVSDTTGVTGYKVYREPQKDIQYLNSICTLNDPSIMTCTDSDAMNSPEPILFYEVRAVKGSSEVP